MRSCNAVYFLCRRQTYIHLMQQCHVGIDMQYKEDRSVNTSLRYAIGDIIPQRYSIMDTSPLTSSK